MVGWVCKECKSVSGLGWAKRYGMSLRQSVHNFHNYGITGITSALLCKLSPHITR